MQRLGAEVGNRLVPAQIRAPRPRGPMVRKTLGGSYVYEYRIERGGDGKRRTRMGRRVGMITLAEGYVPNNGLPGDEEVS